MQVYMRQMSSYTINPFSPIHSAQPIKKLNTPTPPHGLTPDANPIMIPRHQRPLLHCPKKQQPQALVRIPPPSFLDTIFTTAKLNFSITLLCTIHRPMDSLAHRHNSEPCPLLHSQEKQRQWVQVRISLPFLILDIIFRADDYFFNHPATHHPQVSGILGPQTQ